MAGIVRNDVRHIDLRGADFPRLNNDLICRCICVNGDFSKIVVILIAAPGETSVVESSPTSSTYYIALAQVPG